MNFVASITRHPGEIRKIKELWHHSGDQRNPLARVLVTPLFTPASSLELIRALRENGDIGKVIFDSGGYFVQTGRIKYEEMYQRLLDFYGDNRWADHYVLPDYVPLTSDSPDDVWYKVRTTADRGCLFYSEMPADIRSKALPVVQGHTIDQIRYCLNRFLSLEINTIGFGSFATGGKASSVNSVTRDSLEFVAELAQVLSKRGIGLHAFGVGTPPVMFLLHQAGVSSFDSVGWMKTAGFGKIYMPFVRAYNITYHDRTARGLQEHEFNELKSLTNHTCYFCQSFASLAESRDYRIMHNLAVILDTLEQLSSAPSPEIKSILKRFSPQYAKLQSGVFV